MLVSFRPLMVLLTLLAASVSVPAVAQGRSTITFENRSREDALVRLAGPSAGMIPVPDGAARTVAARGGTYRIYVRYGRPGSYRFTRGDPFTVTETDREFEEVTITLHKVADGNYGSSPSNETEFNGGR